MSRQTNTIQEILKHLAAGRVDAGRNLLVGAGLTQTDLQNGRLAQLSTAQQLMLRDLAIVAEYSPGDPRHHLAYGNLELRNGRPDNAVHALGKAIQIRPDLIDAHLALAQCQILLGQVDLAARHLDFVERKGPPVYGVLSELGRLFQLAGQHLKAEHYLMRAIAVDPRNFNDHFLRGNALRELGRVGDAIAAFSVALQINPGHAESYNNRGAALQTLNRDVEALADFERALSHDRRHLFAWINKGVSLSKLERNEESLPAFDAALALNPGMGEIYHNSGLALMKLDRNAEALAMFDTAILADPGKKRKWLLSRGNALNGLHRYEEAVAVFKEVISEIPGSTDAHINMAGALQELGRHADAVAILDVALKQRPGYSEALWNRSNSMLPFGPSKVAWEAYEHRLHLAIGEKLPDYGLPLLGTEDAKGKKILVQWEQRFGDVIQMLRYVPEMQRLCECHWQVAPSLADLARASFPDMRIVDMDACPSGLDARIAYTSLPLTLKTFSVAEIPQKIPYLQPSEVARQKWSGFCSGKGLKIGLTWQGNAKPPGRSIPLRSLLPIFKFEGVTFVSLQMKPSIDELAVLKGVGIQHVGDDIKTFDDSAAALLGLDLVITIDTAIAHLAGAIGRKTWVMLKFGSDWRWMLERNDSPWYPTVMLFRQPSPGLWYDVVQALKVELSKLVATHAV